MDTVPTSTGCPFSWQAFTCSTMARYLPAWVLYTASGQSFRCTGRLVGISTTSSL